MDILSLNNNIFGIDSTKIHIFKLLIPINFFIELEDYIFKYCNKHSFYCFL